MPPLGRTCGFLALIVLVVCATFAGAQAPGYSPMLEGSSVIVPGYAMGPFTLDLSIGDLYWRLGQTQVRMNEVGPQFRPAVEGRFWWGLNIEVLSTAAENAIVALGSPSSDYATRQHIGVGAQESKVVSTYGKPSAIVQLTARPKVLIYDNLGVAFQFPYKIAEGGYDDCDSVFVFRPGQAALVFRTP